MLANADFRIIFNANDVGSHDLGKPSLPAAFDKLVQLTNGTGAGQADLFWADERTLAASATEDLDLNGVLTDVFGAVINALKLVAMVVEANPANVNDVVIGAATNPIPLFGGTSGTLAIKPGGAMALIAPLAPGQLTITPATADRLRLANSGAGTAVTYKIMLALRSA
jgi:hypothetical protein